MWICGLELNYEGNMCRGGRRRRETEEGEERTSNEEHTLLINPFCFFFSFLRKFSRDFRLNDDSWAVKGGWEG